MDNLVVKRARRARVYFSESQNDFLWKTLFLKPAWSHCFIALEGVLINPSWHFIEVCKDEGLYECTTYIDVEFEPPPQKYRFPLQLLTCVTIIKELLGIKHWWIIHPQQLYNYLRRHQYGKFKKPQSPATP